ncbi:S41 family peptidase [Lysobacter arvi]|uniref:S41 family peptidase n=1 Tax=Lysobacter arvi TaxID=3038776 RepID=A0ABU1CFZ9_9GAMM|nr:S41 family peptidase [Lysobacter arvi]MDR0183857.1 S41 family peptidase [Lysobacter arvi]
MPKLLRAVALLCLTAFVLPASAAHAAPVPRERVDAVADAIAANYFDPARGKAIADELRRDAAGGAFDTLAPQALADALTARLRPLDRHFRVRWNGDGAAMPAHVAGSRRPSPQANHGIVAAETLAGDIGHLRLGEFAHFEFEDADAPAREAIDAALASLSGTRAVIVDLRGCRGGSPNMVGYLASAFVAPGADIYNTFRTRGQALSEAPRVPYAAPRTKVPLYVVVDGGTGSAAESFAYTLQSAGRATVVGERSAGAANPGATIDVGDGFSVFVSDGSPVNPITRTNWERTGVVPNVAATSLDALDAALRLARATR